MLKKVVAITLLLVLVLGIMGAAAKDYPSKRITLIIQAAPGGASDTVSRTVAGLMEEKLGVPVVGVNKTGAAGSVAMTYLKKSRPDGYTIGYVPVELTMVNALGYADIKPTDYELLGRAIVIPAAVTVRKDAPWDTIDELIDYAKKNPGAIKVGNSGTGSIWHIAASAFEDEAGIEFNHVPFNGAAPAVASLLGGHIDMVTVSPSEVKSGVDSGDLKVLGVMGTERSDLIPDVKTFKELGYDVNVVAWGGFAAPKNLPGNVKEVLVKAVKDAINSDRFVKLCQQRGMEHSYLSPEEFSSFAKEQFEFYNKLIPAMGLKK